MFAETVTESSSSRAILGIEEIELILLVGAIVAIAARRLRVPYTVGLVAAGIVLAFVPLGAPIPFDKDLLFKILLPPLIFEAALYINWRELKKDLLPVATFATVGVILSALITAGVMHFVVGWTPPAAILFGVLIAATDPVSVIATFKEAAVEGRLRLLVEAESLFNDSTAAVGFTIALAFAAGQTMTVESIAATLFLSVFGGILCGALVGGACLLIAGRTRDHPVELALTTIAAFGSFWFAEYFHWSGVLATMTAGLLVGNTQVLGFITEKGEESIESFWEFVAFVINSIIFIILGINEASQNFGSVVLPIAAAIFAVLVGRAAAIYPLSYLFEKSRRRIDRAHKHIMFWGGLRGALALALALGIPESLPYRGEILTITFGVVAFSVFVQGLTIAPLMKRLGQMPQKPEKPEKPEKPAQAVSAE